MHQGKQKLDSIEKAQQGKQDDMWCSISYYHSLIPLFILGAVSPEKLIHYAHKISQASTAVSPVGWQPSKLQNV